MAYSFSDLYRPLRISMRVNGVVVGLVCGLLLLWGPKGIMDFLRITALDHPPLSMARHPGPVVPDHDWLIRVTGGRGFR